MKLKTINVLSLLAVIMMVMCPARLWADSSEGKDPMFTGLPDHPENSVPYTSVQYGSENVTYLFDGTHSTKWTTALRDKETEKCATAVFKSEKPVRFYGYTITTAQDDSRYPGRTPKTWAFYGWDEENKAWVQIETKENQPDLYYENYSEVHYDCAPAKNAYQLFKWEIIDNHGGKDINGNLIISLYDLKFDYVVDDPETDAWQIMTASDLKAFAKHASSTDLYANAVLMADIDATALGNDVMIGYKDQDDGRMYSNIPYRGVFDGQGHKITINLTSTEKNTALFRCIDADAVIRNLIVDGKITATHKIAAGIAAWSYAGKIENCVSAVDITSTVNGDGTLSGICGVAHRYSSTDMRPVVTISNTAFVGSIIGEKTYKCAGMVAWTEYDAKIENCYVAATFDLDDTSSPMESAHNHTFYRGSSSTVINSYYTNALGAEQKGTQVSEAELTNGSLVEKLNAYSNAWTQGADYPLPFATVDYLWISALDGDAEFAFKAEHADPSSEEEFVTFLYNIPGVSIAWEVLEKEVIVKIPKGETLYLKRADAPSKNLVTLETSYTFLLGGKCKTAMGGNIMSLLDATLQTIDEVGDYALARIFSEYFWVTDASKLKLPAKKLGKNCYQDMFMGSKYLEKAPVLPEAEYEADANPYQEMFLRCELLTELHVEAKTAVGFGDDVLKQTAKDTRGKFYGSPELYAEYKAGLFTLPENWDFVFDENVLIDAQEYTNEEEKHFTELKYVRTYYKNVWNPWFVPFAVPSSVLESNGILEAARIESIHNYDMDKDGTIDRTVLEVLLVKDGILKAGLPYLVKPGDSYTYPLVVENVTLKPASVKGKIHSETASSSYDFEGTYTGLDASVLAGGKYYSLDKYGVIVRRTTNVLPQRWYMKEVAKANPYEELPAADASREFVIKVIGEEYGTTGVQTIYPCDEQREEVMTDGIFDLSGRALSAPQRGSVNIVNGKKQIVR